jgi:2-polyprenyl-3-methyl-5-hydroxy-6-metoxy-1,4-benzoquinol methylase
MSDSRPKHEGWDAYWSTDAQGAHRLYAVLASFYRRIFISGRLAYWLGRNFPTGSRLLHAGCGGGEVDVLIAKKYKITALDISPNALHLYKKHNAHVVDTIHADLLSLEFSGRTFDGAYNLGVMEHFESPEIVTILCNLSKVVKPGGRLVLFWPLANAPSVKFLALWHSMLNRCAKSAVELHPPEINLIRSKSEIEEKITAAGLKMINYNITPFDLMIQAVIVIYVP